MSIEIDDSGLFVIWMQPTETWPARSVADRKLHHDWLERCETETITVLGGRFDRDLSEDQQGAGLHMIRAASRQHALDFADSEPYAVSGFRSSSVHRWSIAKGSMSIPVRLLGNEV